VRWANELHHPVREHRGRHADGGGLYLGFFQSVGEEPDDAGHEQDRDKAIKRLPDLLPGDAPLFVE
jgi:hypothetical protein